MVDDIAKGAQKSKKESQEPTPWANQPFPIEGDADINTTYASVGRALTHWEEFESQLALIFARLVGSARQRSEPAERAYGSVRIFEVRSHMVDDAADMHFALQPFPSQELEALQKEIRALTNKARNHAVGRRNEIAHGAVANYAAFMSGAPKGFVLGPPAYMTNKRAIRKIDEIKVMVGTVGAPATERRMNLNIIGPTYIYSSRELDKFGEGFRGLVPVALDIANRLRR